MSADKNQQRSVVVIQGSIDGSRSQALHKQLSSGLQQAREQGHKELLVAWENPGDIDGIGLALLLATYLEFKNEGGRICLRGFSEKHQELLKITRTDQLFVWQDEAA